VAAVVCRSRASPWRGIADPGRRPAAGADPGSEKAAAEALSSPSPCSKHHNSMSKGGRRVVDMQHKAASTPLHGAAARFGTAPPTINLGGAGGHLSADQRLRWRGSFGLPNLPLVPSVGSMFAEEHHAAVMVTGVALHLRGRAARGGGGGGVVGGGGGGWGVGGGGGGGAGGARDGGVYRPRRAIGLDQKSAGSLPQGTGGGFRLETRPIPAITWKEVRDKTPASSSTWRRGQDDGRARPPRRRPSSAGRIAGEIGKALSPRLCNRSFRTQHLGRYCKDGESAGASHRRGATRARSAWDCRRRLGPHLELKPCRSNANIAIWC